MPRSPVPLQLFGLASTLGTTSLDELEQRARAISRDQVKTWFSGIDGTEEVALLSTCHRVELVLLLRSRAGVDCWLDVLPGTRSSWTIREGGELVHHLFRVAAGRESLARGEIEVRHQIRTAGRWVQSRHPRPVLASLFSAAVGAAEELSPPTLPARSVAVVAADALLDLMDGPFPRVLIVGAGTVGRQVTERLSSAARVRVVYHHRVPADEFVQATGVRPVPYDLLSEELESADAVVTAVKSGVPCLRASQLPRNRPLLLLDLGVPRNIDPEVRKLPNVRLIDLEELHEMFRPPPSGETQDAQVENLARRWSDELERQLREPWIGSLWGAAEAVRRSELAQARRFLGTLTPEQEVALDRLTRRLVASFLVPPTERLRSLPSGREGDRQRRFALELLRPGLADP